MFVYAIIRVERIVTVTGGGDSWNEPTLNCIRVNKSKSLRCWFFDISLLLGSPGARLYFAKTNVISEHWTLLTDRLTIQRACLAVKFILTESIYNILIRVDIVVLVRMNYEHADCFDQTRMIVTGYWY